VRSSRGGIGGARRIEERDLRAPRIPGQTFELAASEERLGAERRVADAVGLLCGRRRDLAGGGDLAGIAQGLRACKLVPQACDATGEARVRWLAPAPRAIERGGRAADVDAPKRFRGAHGVLHHIRVTGGKHFDESAELLTPFGEARNAPIEERGRLLAAHVGRLACVDVHRHPVARPGVERALGGLPRVGRERQMGGEECVADAAFPGVVPDPREPLLGALAHRAFSLSCPACPGGDSDDGDDDARRERKAPEPLQGIARELGEELVHGRLAVLRRAAHSAMQGPAHVHGDTRRPRRRRRGEARLADIREDLLDARAAEGMLAVERLVERYAEAEEIGPGVRALAAALLRGHVGPRPEHGARHGEIAAFAR
jgi:hypothetical protein